ncbi:MAG: hypothetical protein JO070_03890, partial [Verrucomicrobia bacterium]|nr:hypothetical protein [Verrucomicrobiota bacterium]
MTTSIHHHQVVCDYLILLTSSTLITSRNLVLVLEFAYTRPAKLVCSRLMRLCIFILTVGLTGTVFARLGDTEKQLTDRYGEPVSVLPGGRYNPYFDKWIDYRKQGIAISCGMHAGRCVTIQYDRQSGFKNAEFTGFKMFNSTGSPIYAERNATSLKFTFKKDYPEIVKASQKGISRMRR